MTTDEQVLDELIGSPMEADCAIDESLRARLVADAEDRTEIAGTTTRETLLNSGVRRRRVLGRPGRGRRRPRGAARRLRAARASHGRGLRSAGHRPGPGVGRR